MTGKGNTCDNKTNGGYGLILKCIGLFGGVQVFSVLMSLLRNKISSSLLGVSGLGLIALYNRTVQLFNDCTNLGLPISAVRWISEAYENEGPASVRHRVKTVRSISLLAGICGMSLFLLFSPLVMRWLSAGDHSGGSSNLLCLAPVLLFMAVYGGELSVLRGVRELDKLAKSSLLIAAASVAVVAAAYYFLGFDGIVPVIFMLALLQMAGVLCFSLKCFRYEVSLLSTEMLKEGKGLVKVGLGYVYASILASCSIWLLYKLLFDIGGDVAVGLFSAGYLLVTMLPQVLFAALDFDYYPRLSGVFGKKAERDSMVNEHIEVHLLVQIPVIACFILMQPVLIPLLYTSDFVEVVHMVQIALVGLLFNCIAHPISFMALAKGDRRAYFIQETVHFVLLVALLLLGYRGLSFTGIGIAMVAVYAVDLVVVYVIARRRFGFVMSGNVLKFFLLNMPSVALLLYSAMRLEGWLYWVVGGLCVAVSSVISLSLMKRQGVLLLRSFKRLFLKR